MPLFSRSRTSSSNSSSRNPSTSGGSRIEVVNPTYRPNQQYIGNLEESNIPSFVRTGSYYATTTNEPVYRYLIASDVRRQVLEAPSELASASTYPKEYGNKPPLPLSAQPPYREFPIRPSPQGGSAPQNYRSGKPGPVRAFYNEDNRTQFDVGYHDPNKPPSGPRNGSTDIKHQFSLATYHPAPTYTEVRRS